MTMDKRVFERLRAIIYEKSGIALHEGKEALVCARLRKRMRLLSCRRHCTRKNLQRGSSLSAAKIGLPTV